MQIRTLWGWRRVSFHVIRNNNNGNNNNDNDKNNDNDNNNNNNDIIIIISFVVQLAVQALMRFQPTLNTG